MRIEIVENIKDKMKEDNKYVKAVISGKTKIDKKRAAKILVLTPETFHSVFSIKRIILLKEIKKNKANSIYELAKALKRPYESVYRDIKYLEGFGFIKIKQRKNSKIPFLAEDKIEVPALV